MLNGQILNSDASLNNFIVTNSKGFIPGEQFDLVVRIFNDELSIRYVPPTTAIIKFTFTNTDGTTLEKTSAPVDALDLSMQKMTIEETESANIIGGNFSFEIDVLGDATQIRKGIVENGLAKFIEGNC